MGHRFGIKGVGERVKIRGQQFGKEYGGRRVVNDVSSKWKGGAQGPVGAPMVPGKTTNLQHKD